MQFVDGMYGLYLDPDFEPVKSPLGSPRASVTSVTSCTSTLSTQSGGKDSSKQRYEITKAGLAKFAKRLTSKDKSSNNKVIHQFPSAIPNITIPTSPSVPAKLEVHRRGDIPSSPSVPNKLTNWLSGQCLENPEVLLEGLPLSKTERKRLEKLNKINIDLQALFVSVEHEHLERARSILSTTDVNVNW
ncbi:hypothetical protein AVEN_256037-1 [Araneus ventricosus]|uniref:Uncharacterized protein n=1 Tax=Araneus ventricosus TaxID=182803 RepID=A0A4Y2JH25_ARAVE|nr:hypothetical protein AVEN_256037-1 [Araneus ventricosus]